VRSVHRQRTLYCEVTRTTDDAVLVEYGDEEFWVPRSVCLAGDQIEEGDTEIIIANWWLQAKGII
jgi:hypothetical protein